MESGAKAQEEPVTTAQKEEEIKVFNRGLKLLEQKYDDVTHICDVWQPPEQPLSHWGYLLEECKWMAKDFKQELKWKRFMAKFFAHQIAHIDRHKYLKPRAPSSKPRRQKALNGINNNGVKANGHVSHCAATDAQSNGVGKADGGKSLENGKAGHGQNGSPSGRYSSSDEFEGSSSGKCEVPPWEDMKFTVVTTPNWFSKLQTVISEIEEVQYIQYRKRLREWETSALIMRDYYPITRRAPTREHKEVVPLTNKRKPEAYPVDSQPRKKANSSPAILERFMNNEMTAVIYASLRSICHELVSGEPRQSITRLTMQINYPFIASMVQSAFSLRFRRVRPTMCKELLERLLFVQKKNSLGRDELVLQQPQLTKEEVQEMFTTFYPVPLELIRACMEAIRVTGTKWKVLPDRPTKPSTLGATNWDEQITRIHHQMGNQLILPRDMQSATQQLQTVLPQIMGQYGGTLNHAPHNMGGMINASQVMQHVNVAPRPMPGPQIQPAPSQELSMGGQGAGKTPQTPNAAAGSAGVPRPQQQIMQAQQGQMMRVPGGVEMAPAGMRRMPAPLQRMPSQHPPQYTPHGQEFQPLHGNLPPGMQQYPQMHQFTPHLLPRSDAGVQGMPPMMGGQPGRGSPIYHPQQAPGQQGQRPVMSQGQASPMAVQVGYMGVPQMPHGPIPHMGLNAGQPHIPYGAIQPGFGHMGIQGNMPMPNQPRPMSGPQPTGGGADMNQMRGQVGMGHLLPPHGIPGMPGMPIHPAIAAHPMMQAQHPVGLQPGQGPVPGGMQNSSGTGPMVPPSAMPMGMGSGAMNAVQTPQGMPNMGHMPPGAVGGMMQADGSMGGLTANNSTRLRDMQSLQAQ